MSHPTKNEPFVDPSTSNGIVYPILRILRLCSKMQRQVNQYH
ncbi:MULTISPECIES: hypothetical protein [unclassified Ruegeria]|nr:MULTISPECIES: hypothetical protein [unclassified Ruegeria]